MADQKISQLPVATVIQPADISVLVDSNVDYQYSFTLLLSFLSANLGIGASVYFGTALPANGFGNNGDIFINTTTQSFAQKAAGVWTVVYTISGQTQDGTTLFGSGLPGTIGKNGDTYIDTLTGIFYQRPTGTWAQVFSMLSGPPGVRGNSLLTGIIAPTGGVGINGDSYLDTVHLMIYSPKTGGVWPAGVSIAPQVPNTILNGAANPSNGTGNDGDFYINITTWYIFGPKALGAWPTGVSLGNSLFPPVLITITAGVTGTPKTVAYNLSDYPNGAKYELIRTSDNSYDWNTNVQKIIPVSGSPYFVINGADKGDGTFADSFRFSILF